LFQQVNFASVIKIFKNKMKGLNFKQQSCLTRLKTIPKYGILLFMFFLSLNMSCKKFTFRNEIIRCDSLIADLNNAKKVFIIDDEFLSLRIDSMNIISKYIGTLDSTRFNDELKFDFVTYKGILKSYTEYLQIYQSNVYDNSVLLNSVQLLRKNFLEKNSDKNNAINELSNLKLMVESHTKSVKTNIRNIINLENIYTRVSPKISDFYIKYKGN